MHSRLQCPTLIAHARHSRRPRRQGEEIFQRNEQRLPSGAPRGIGRRISLISACVPSYPTARALRKLTFSRLIRARASAHAIPATSSRHSLSRAANTSLKTCFHTSNESAEVVSRFFPIDFRLRVIIIAQCKIPILRVCFDGHECFNGWNFERDPLRLRFFNLCKIDAEYIEY